jgi:hypothetical protein
MTLIALLAGSQPGSYTLPTKFFVYGVLEVREPHEVVPKGADSGLYLIIGNRDVRVTKLTQLAGHVRIRSADEALDFARLGKTPTTWGFFGGPFEIRSWAPVDPNGPTWKGGPAVRIVPPDGEYGVVPEGWMKHNGLSKASVRRTPRGWRVEMWITFAEARPSSSISLLSEEFAEDGTLLFSHVGPAGLAKWHPMGFWHFWRRLAQVPLFAMRGSWPCSRFSESGLALGSPPWLSALPFHRALSTT